MHRLGVTLARADWVRMALLAVAVTWVPIIVLSIVEWRATGKLPALVLSYSLHAKLLVAIPVLLAAERGAAHAHLPVHRAHRRRAMGGARAEGARADHRRGTPA